MCTIITLYSYVMASHIIHGDPASLIIYKPSIDHIRSHMPLCGSIIIVRVPVHLQHAS